jgi:hypothetical protein
MSHSVGHNAGPIAQIDFTSNPAMMKPFMDWIRSGEAWVALAEWYIEHKDEYGAG